MLLRERVDRVLRRVGGEALAVVTVEVNRGEVAGQRDADVVVDQLVRVGVPVDPHHPGLGFAVLVMSERHTHDLSSLGRWNRRTARAAGGRGGATRGR
jgi:hypothetical protein